MENMGKKCGAIGFALYLDLLSELDVRDSEFDVDVLILYSDSTSPALLALKKEELISEGKSVTAEKKIPDKLRYRQLISL
jgi:ATP phosphoribosyltransferase regulatory subunit